jgi:quercetin dioxygenase-like cupin family protein
MRIRTRTAVLCAAAAGVAVGSLPSLLRATTAPPTASSATVHDLMARDLIAAPGKEVRMLTVEYAPGAASLPHRHHAQVFVYVLEGALRMQVQGSPRVTLKAGDTFYEGPDDVHAVSANASDTDPARFLVFTVKDKGAPVSSAADQEPRP